MKFEYFDQNSLKFYLDDSEGIAFVIDLIETWISNADKKYWPNIDVSLVNKNKSLLKDNIHPFKSSCGQIGFSKLFKDGDDIDKIFIHQDWSLIEEKVTELKELYLNSKKEAIIFKTNLMAS